MADVPPERKPERGYVRQNHPFTKPPFYLPMTLFGVDKRVVSKRVVSADVPPERKPERGYVRQNHPFTKPPFYLPVIEMALRFDAVSQKALFRGRLRLIVVGCWVERRCGCELQVDKATRIREKRTKPSWCCHHSDVRHCQTPFKCCCHAAARVLSLHLLNSEGHE